MDDIELEVGNDLIPVEEFINKDGWKLETNLVGRTLINNKTGKRGIIQKQTSGQLWVDFGKENWTRIVLAYANKLDNFSVINESEESDGVDFDFETSDVKTGMEGSVEYTNKYKKKLEDLGYTVTFITPLSEYRRNALWYYDKKILTLLYTHNFHTVQIDIWSCGNGIEVYPNDHNDYLESVEELEENGFFTDDDVFDTTTEGGSNESDCFFDATLRRPGDRDYIMDTSEFDMGWISDIDCLIEDFLENTDYIESLIDRMADEGDFDEEDLNEDVEEDSEIELEPSEQKVKVVGRDKNFIEITDRASKWEIKKIISSIYAIGFKIDIDNPMRIDMRASYDNGGSLVYWAEGEGYASIGLDKTTWGKILNVLNISDYSELKAMTEDLDSDIELDSPDATSPYSITYLDYYKTAIEIHNKEALDRISLEINSNHRLCAINEVKENRDNVLEGDSIYLWPTLSNRVGGCFLFRPYWKDTLENIQIFNDDYTFILEKLGLSEEEVMEMHEPIGILESENDIDLDASPVGDRGHYADPEDTGYEHPYYELSKEQCDLLNSTTDGEPFNFPDSVWGELRRDGDKIWCEFFSLEEEEESCGVIFDITDEDLRLIDVSMDEIPQVTFPDNIYELKEDMGGIDLDATPNSELFAQKFVDKYENQIGYKREKYSETDLTKEEVIKIIKNDFDDFESKYYVSYLNKGSRYGGFEGTLKECLYEFDRVVKEGRVIHAILANSSDDYAHKVVLFLYVDDWEDKRYNFKRDIDIHSLNLDEDINEIEFDASENSNAIDYIISNGVEVPMETKEAITSEQFDWDDVPVDEKWTVVKDDDILHNQNDTFHIERYIEDKDLPYYNYDYGCDYILFYGDDYSKYEYIYNFYAHDYFGMLKEDLDVDSGIELEDSNMDFEIMDADRLEAIFLQTITDKAREMVIDCYVHGWFMHDASNNYYLRQSKFSFNNEEELREYIQSNEKGKQYLLAFTERIGDSGVMGVIGELPIINLSPKYVFEALDKLNFTAMTRKELCKYIYSRNFVESKGDKDKFLNWLNNNRELFDRFFKEKQRLEHKDLYYWMDKTPEDLEKELDSLGNTNSEDKQNIMEGAKLVSEDEFWAIYRVDTPEASDLLGKGTKWCITGTDVSEFKIPTSAFSKKEAKNYIQDMYDPDEIISVEHDDDDDWGDVYEVVVKMPKGKYYFNHYIDEEDAEYYFLISKKDNTECYKDESMNKIAIKTNSYDEMSAFDSKDNEIEIESIPHFDVSKIK